MVADVIALDLRHDFPSDLNVQSCPPQHLAKVDPD